MRLARLAQRTERMCIMREYDARYVCSAAAHASDRRERGAGGGGTIVLGLAVMEGGCGQISHIGIDRIGTPSTSFTTFFHVH